MGWLIALNSVLYIAAIVLFFAGYGWLSLICLVLAILLTCILSSGGTGSSGFDFLSDIPDFFD